MIPRNSNGAIVITAALAAAFGPISPRPEQREKDPARDAERILAAKQKRARKAARRAARNKV